MVDASRFAVAGQLSANSAELKELAALSGKNRGMAQVMVARLETDRKNYQLTVQAFRATYNKMVDEGIALIKQLDDASIEQILSHDREFIQGAWTTAGMWKNMQGLFRHFTSVSSRMLNLGNQIKNGVEAAYGQFHSQFGFPKLAPPALNLEKHTLAMTGMEQTARQFCHDPVNVAKYKDFVVRQFYESLVGQARQIFEMTRMDVEAWIKSALNPLNLQIKEHEKVLAKRLENFKKIRDNIGSVEDRIKLLQKMQVALQQQSIVLNRIKSCLDGDRPPEPTVVTRAQPVPALA
jgi:hypothetical protein